MSQMDAGMVGGGSHRILSDLRGVARKVRVLAVLFGIGVVVAAAVGALLGTVGLDYLFNLRAVPRLLVMGVAGVGIGYVLARWVAMPAVRRITLSDVAQRLEHVFPEFDDRLRSAVDFLSNPVPGSEAMKDRVVGQAEEITGRVDLGRAIAKRPVYWALASGAAALLLGALIMGVVSDSYRSIALARLLHPFDGPRWPKKVQIDVVGDVPERVPVGQQVEVRMRLARGDKESMRAVVVYRTNDGALQQEYMKREPDGTYVARIDARLDPNASGGRLNVSLKSGDDEVQLKPVEIVPRLGLTRVEAQVTPPKYAQLPPTVVNLANQPAVMAAGSQVELRVGFNKPLAGDGAEIAPVAADMAKPDVKWSKPDASTLVGRWTVSQSVRFHLIGRDADGFTNPGLEEFELMVKPDQMPVVQIENPRRNEERTPEAVVPLQVLAEDDYGVSALKLVVDRLGDKKHWEVELLKDGTASGGATWERADASGDRQRFRMNWAWELKQLADAGLKPGDLLEYYVVAQDNYELDGKRHEPVASGRLRIAIISQDQLATKVAEEMRLIAGNVEQIRTGQLRTRQETQALREDTAQKPQMDAGDRAAAERLAGQQGGAASQTKQAAGKVEALRQRLEENRSQANELKQAAADVAGMLNSAAEGPMKDAAASVAQSKEGNQKPEERNPKLDNALARQQESVERLNNALERMGNTGGLRQAIEQVAALLEAQKKVGQQTAEIGKGNLGKRPDQLSAEDRKKLEANAAEQKALADRTAKALEQMLEQSKQMDKTDSQTSKALEQAARTGQQQQVPAKQQQASESAKQNQQAQAQQAQKQAEIGLELMLSGLREAERHKLEELSKQLAQLQEQVDRLVRRQAGHNLDNLAVQGPEVLRKTESQILADLVTQAARPKDVAGVVPDLAQLTAGQEQTERNARDIGKTADGVPGAQEVAGLLVRAAGKMERAAVLLREQKLPAAYDPPQVEALATLLDAKRKVDAMKKEVDQKLGQQDKEAIRQAFEKIKADQEKLNGETAAIDNAPKLADGSLPRVQAVRLGQLPGEQGKLADRTAELDERLSALGGIVYVWANKDIRDSMNGVKQALGKAATGAPTQDEQARVVDQLDAMIRSLAVKPLESKFEQRASGGGGGGGGQSKKQLPSEAELRLARELQRAINQQTERLDKAEVKDKERLMALGNRQGELRKLLDELMQKSSDGEIKLGKEPENRDQLPEEVGQEKGEDELLEKQLLSDEQATEKTDRSIGLLGDRMSRVRQRLALNGDPGKTTRAIEEKIVTTIDELIEMARKQQSKQKPQQNQQLVEQNKQQQPGEAKPESQQAEAKPQPSQSQQAARQSAAPGSADVKADLSQEIKQTMSEWGGLTKRQRDAVIEGMSETVVEKYKNLVDDYYRSLAEKK